MKHRSLLLLVLAPVALCAASFAFLGRSEKVAKPAGACTPVNATALQLELVADGFSYPVDIQSPANDARLFVVEQAGLIRIVDENGKRQSAFLDLTSRIEAHVATYDERGLLGFAFHPDYAKNGRFFVNYTLPEGPAHANSRISEFRVSKDRELADVASERVLLEVTQPFTNHEGGGLAFGPDGYLYVGFGDGGAGCDPMNSAQDPTKPLGKMLRIDVAELDAKPLPINPVDSVCARGLRNPWRFSFDRKNGDFYIGDVGQNTLEEVDVVPANMPCGHDFGWPSYEGSKCPNPSCQEQRPCMPNAVPPVVEYGRLDGCTVIGGYVYRGACLPSLAGTYFYADWCSGWLRSFRFDGKQAVDKREWPALKLNKPSSFGQDARGELYVLSHSEGNLYRIVAGVEKR